MLAPPEKSPPRVLTEINTLEGLRLALRDRREALNVSFEAVDTIAGLTPGHASKLLSPTPIKKLGDTSLPLLLGALGLKLILIEDTAAFERVRTRLVPRQTNALRVSACLWGRSGQQYEVSRRWVKQVAAKGGRARAQALTPKQRSKQARRAALIRWAHVRATVRAAAVARAERGGAKNG
jgi:hypothetical protein